MFGIRTSSHHAVPQYAAPHSRAIRKLDAALADLPAPWRVLRNRRARADDGPPWTKYIVLHPEKGIALVDLVPANPHSAIAPLDEFLARTGFAAFSHGDPPIIAVALTEREVPSLTARLSEGFAREPRCGIKNANWVDAVIKLLVSTPSLLLTQVGGHAPQRARDRQEPIVDRATQAPPAETRSSRVETPKENGSHSSRSEPSWQPSLNAAPKPESDRPQISDWHADRLTSFEHRERRRRPARLGLIAGSLAAGVALAILYLHVTTGPGPTTTTSLAGNAPQTTDLPSAGRVETLLPPLGQPPAAANIPSPQPNVATPPQAVATLEAPPTEVMPPAKPAVAPRTEATIETPPAKAIPPAKPDAVPGTTAGGPKPDVPAAAPASATPPAPGLSPKNAAPQPKSETPKSAATSKPPVVATKPPVLLEPPAAPEHTLKEVHLKPPSQLPQAAGAGSPKTAALEPLPASDANEETVTINGLTYVKGREPQALGSVTSSADNSTPVPAANPGSPTPLAPRTVGSGDNQVLIQPE